jgi:hypothetical protein
LTTLPRLRWLRGWRGPMRLRRGGRDAMNLGLRSRSMLNSRRSCFDFLPWRRRLAGLGLGGDGMPSLGLRRRSMMDLGRRRFACLLHFLGDSRSRSGYWLAVGLGYCICRGLGGGSLGRLYFLRRLWSSRSCFLWVRGWRDWLPFVSRCSSVVRNRRARECILCGR